MRTPISYYGGNQSVIGHILPMIPKHTVYTEVYFGGGTVFFAKDPSHIETINDRLDYVVNFYRQLQNNYPALKKLINATLFSRTQHREAHAFITNKKKCNKVQLAWAFWMCSNFSYSNKMGAGIKYSNVTHAPGPSVMINKKIDVTEALVKRIENTYIENNDAITILNSRNTSDAFHFIDPPYIGADQGHYKGFGTDELIELLDTCENIKGKFLLLNYDSDILDMYVHKNKWYRKQIEHRIAAPRKSGTVKRLVFVWNYDVAAISQPTLFDKQ